jgi:hypothetical protein
MGQENVQQIINTDDQIRNEHGPRGTEHLEMPTNSYAAYIYISQAPRCVHTMYTVIIHQAPPVLPHSRNPSLTYSHIQLSFNLQF